MPHKYKNGFEQVLGTIPLKKTVSIKKWVKCFYDVLKFYRPLPDLQTY